MSRQIFHIHITHFNKLNNFMSTRNAHKQALIYITEYTTGVDRKLTQNILIYRERLKSALDVEYMKNLLKPIQQVQYIHDTCIKIFLLST